MCAICDPLVVDERIQHPFIPQGGAELECATCGRHVSVHPDKVKALVSPRRRVFAA